MNQAVSGTPLAPCFVSWFRSAYRSNGIVHRRLSFRMNLLTTNGPFIMK